MYRDHRIAVIAPCYNEASKIGEVVRRVTDTQIADVLLVVDDGSTDESALISRRGGAEVQSLGSVQGVGAALRAGLKNVRSRVDIVVIIAGNNKDEPKEIPRLLDPIIDGKARFVQGSRFLRTGGYGGEMPFYRKVATRAHPLLMSLLTGHWVTESTNGFRAFQVSLLSDPRIHLDQPWLDGYELEPYLLYKVVSGKIPFAEVPVTKIYPPRKLGYTKMRPLVDWWRILRPLFLLRLGLKR